MYDFTELWVGGPSFAQSEHFKLGTDTVLMSDFVNTANRKRGIDLGCGSGAVPLLLLTKSEKLHMTGLEINADAAACAEANMEKNGLSERSRIVCGDIRNVKALFQSGEFELVTANPPYFPQGSGKASPDPARAAARGEMLCSLEDICAAASYLCKTGGAFCMVHRAERMTDVFCTLRQHGFEPKRLRLVSHKADSEPSLMLVEARRGGASGVKVLPTLVVRNADGTETDEILKIYHREDTK